MRVLVTADTKAQQREGEGQPQRAADGSDPLRWRPCLTQLCEAALAVAGLPCHIQCPMPRKPATQPDLPEAHEHAIHTQPEAQKHKPAPRHDTHLYCSTV